MRSNYSEIVYDIKEEEIIGCGDFIVQLTHQNP